MMKPYSDRYLTHDQRIFNYRCSRGRRVVENAFGILAARWRVLLRPMEVTPENARKVVKAAVVLHNKLRDANPTIPQAELDHEGLNGQIIPGAWRTAGVMREVEAVAERGTRIGQKGKQQREYLKHYFLSKVGKVPWQEDSLAAAMN